MPPAMSWLYVEGFSKQKRWQKDYLEGMDLFPVRFLRDALIPVIAPLAVVAVKDALIQKQAHIWGNGSVHIPSRV